MFAFTWMVLPLVIWMFWFFESSVDDDRTVATCQRDALVLDELESVSLAGDERTRRDLARCGVDGIGRQRRRVVLAVPEATEHVGRVEVAELEADQHLVADLGKDEESAVRTGTGLDHSGPPAREVAREPRERQPYASHLQWILRVTDDADDQTATAVGAAGAAALSAGGQTVERPLLASGHGKRRGVADLVVEEVPGACQRVFAGERVTDVGQCDRGAGAQLRVSLGHAVELGARAAELSGERVRAGLRPRPAPGRARRRRRSSGLANVFANDTGSVPWIWVPAMVGLAVADTARLFSKSQPCTSTSGTCSAAVIEARSETSVRCASKTSGSAVAFALCAWRSGRRRGQLEVELSVDHSDLCADRCGEPRQEVPVADIVLADLCVLLAAEAGDVVDVADVCRPARCVTLRTMSATVMFGIRGDPPTAEQPVRLVVAAHLGERPGRIEVESDRGDLAGHQRLWTARVGRLDLQLDLGTDGDVRLGEHDVVGVAEAQHKHVGQVAAVVDVAVREQGLDVVGERRAADLDD